MKAMQPAIACGEFITLKYYFEVRAVYDERCCYNDNYENDRQESVYHPLHVVPVVNP